MIKRLFLIFMLTGFLANAQTDNFQFKRKLSGFENGKWVKIILPNEMFGKLNTNFSDLRIFGITAENDTVQAPYFLKRPKGKQSVKAVNFERINSSKDENGYYFTFKLTENQPINKIKLKFKNPNFNWKVSLEGSHNQQKWFSILEDYRILSIQNETVDYHFTTLDFPKSSYNYFRVFIKTKSKPEFVSARLDLKNETKPTYRNYTVNSFAQKEKGKQTKIDIHLKQPVPVSYLKFQVNADFDYYRPIRLTYLSDSVKTVTGWHYNYRSLTTGVLSSVEKNAFTFPSKIVQDLRITIDNADNSPLNIKTAQVKGFVHQLIARFPEKADYFLAYGNPKAHKPVYDIARFKNKIPHNLQTLKLGEEIRVADKKQSTRTSLFTNKYWLWGIIIAIVLLLGFLTIGMMRKR